MKSSMTLHIHGDFDFLHPVSSLSQNIRGKRGEHWRRAHPNAFLTFLSPLLPSEVLTSKKGKLEIYSPHLYRNLQGLNALFFLSIFLLAG
jgi:hypothetical protein